MLKHFKTKMLDKNSSSDSDDSKSSSHSKEQHVNKDMKKRVSIMLPKKEKKQKPKEEPKSKQEKDNVKIFDFNISKNTLVSKQQTRKDQMAKQKRHRKYMIEHSLEIPNYVFFSHYKENKNTKIKDAVQIDSESEDEYVVGDKEEANAMKNDLELLINTLFQKKSKEKIYDTIKRLEKMEMVADYLQSAMKVLEVVYTLMSLLIEVEMYQW